MESDWVRNKLEAISDTMTEHSVHLAKISVSLDEHMRRTAILEAKLEPVEKHVNFINGLVKSLSIVAIALGILKTSSLI